MMATQISQVSAWIKPWLLGWLFVMSLLTLLSYSVYAEYSPQEEYEIKARFLYNVARMVRWPAADAKLPLVFCFMGKDLFGNTLNTIKNKTIDERPLEFKRNVSLNEIKQCQVLFIGGSEQSRLAELLASAEKSYMLTVGDMEEFAEQGGMVHLVKEEKRIRIAVNLRAAHRAAVELSSRLLTVATVVEK